MLGMSSFLFLLCSPGTAMYSELECNIIAIDDKNIMPDNEKKKQHCEPSLKYIGKGLLIAKTLISFT